MNTHITGKRTWLTAPLCILLLSACDVHEFPVETEPERQEVTLHLNFHTDLPLHQVVEQPTSRAVSSAPEDYDIRYQVRIYKADESGAYDKESYQPVLETKDEVTALNHDLHLTLEVGNYRFVVWTDYVDDGGQDDKFYATDDFEEITLQGETHPGNTDFRDAFRGQKETTVTAGAEPQEVTVEMERPMARYNFVTTDLDVFLTRVLEQQAAAGQSNSREGSDTKAVNLDDYRVTFLYTGFMPSAFNILSNAPVDARTGVSFEGQLKQLSDTEAEVGFDYVFVNGSESTVQVALQVCDAAGEVVATAGPIDVPLMRSRLTTVRGAFLTSEASGSVGIQPGFDGEWNYEIR